MVLRASEYRQSAEGFAFHTEVCRSKRRYRTRKIAKRAATLRQRTTENPLRVYQCAVCNQWHLTSLKHRSEDC